MALDPTPASYVDWDDADVVEGEALSREDVEQLLNNQRYFNQQLSTSEAGPWGASEDDFFDHFTRPEAQCFGVLSGAKMESSGIAGSVVVTRDGSGNHFCTLDEVGGSEGWIRSHTGRVLAAGSWYTEARIKPSAWNASNNFIWGMNEAWEGAGNPVLAVNGVYLVRGTTTNTWRLLTRRASVTEEDTDDIASGVLWTDWVVVRLTCTAASVILSMGPTRDDLTDLATHDINLPTSALMQLVAGQTTSGGTLALDYVGVQTIGNPVSP